MFATPEMPLACSHVLVFLKLTHVFSRLYLMYSIAMPDTHTMSYPPLLYLMYSIAMPNAHTMSYPPLY
jgi:hypothetical protein